MSVGHDDAFAILFAAHHPAIDLLGISTVHGNSSVEHTTVNAGSILTAIGKPNVPVYVGAADGLVRPAVHAPAIHGESGLDGTALLPPPAMPAIRDVPAIDAMADALLATAPRTSWLVATGTLTNIAALFIKYPQLEQHIKGLSIMGGAVGGGFTNAPLGHVGNEERYGNWTPYAVCDPEAAHEIFTRPTLSRKTTLISLDLTHLVLATPQVQQLLLHGPHTNNAATSLPNDSTSNDAKSIVPSSRLRTLLVELLTFFATTYATIFGITAGPPLHDPLAVAAILDGLPGLEMPFYDFRPDDHTADTSSASSASASASAGAGAGAPGDDDLSPRAARRVAKAARERFAVTVVTEGTHEQALRGETQTGRTIVRLLPEGDEGVRIPRGLDVQRFWRVLEDCLRRADEENARLGTSFA
ncbi:MAG: Uridine nucleosidase 1 [Claussenomyces sp. TS43310]|nr:MAG: Uridine nucleosidase 1 [Claussenomyces sp. TS43310]